jgi:crotonobetainyl-CoA:carnitine CoA-transferase CaiB-like acyl-CoA transferase
MVPHGVYPAAGDDRWVAIAAANDTQWRALCDVIGRPEIGADPRYADVAGRRRHADVLDAVVSGWTCTRDAQTVEAELQAVGVAAHAVSDGEGVFRDPQLAHRGRFVTLDHPVLGTTVVDGPRAHLSRTPARVERAAPTFGRDNFEVLSEILGYDAERIAELAAADVLR